MKFTSISKAALTYFQTRKTRKGLSDKTLARASAVLYSFMLSTPAFALFENANTLLQDVGQGLLGLAVATITIAVIVVGYKVLWDGKNLKDCSNIIIGAAIIGGASALAGAIFVQ